MTSVCLVRSDAGLQHRAKVLPTVYPLEGIWVSFCINQISGETLFETVNPMSLQTAAANLITHPQTDLALPISVVCWLVFTNWRLTRSSGERAASTEKMSPSDRPVCGGIFLVNDWCGRPDLLRMALPLGWRSWAL